MKRFTATALVAALILSGSTLSAVAQSGNGQFPGLIVTVPPRDQATAAQPATTAAPKRPAAAAPRRAPQVRNKPPRTKKAAARPPKRVERTPAPRKLSVAVLVNDEPITNHEIDQRARLMAVGSISREQVNSNFKALIKRKSTNQRLRAILQETIEANRGRSRDEVLAIFEKRKQAYAKSLQRQAVASARSASVPKYRRRATKELVEERLKMQEAKRLNSLASWSDVDSAIATIAKRNKVSLEKFFKSIGSSGARPTTFKEKIRAQLSWQSVIRRRFGALITVNLKEIEQQVARTSTSDDVQLRVHTITLPLPNKVNQAVIAKRLQEAEALQSKFSGCRSTKVVARQIKDAKYNDLGRVKSSSIPEPTRSLLLQAQDGEMVPPATTRKGVVLYAVCGRNAAGSKDKARSQARNALQQREFEIMGRRHLADLKRDAHIEYR